MRAKYIEQNTQVLDQLKSSDNEIRKEASIGVNDWLRMRSREDGFMRRIIPPDSNVTPADCDRQTAHRKLVIVKDKEPNTAPAMSVPFGNVPENEFIDAERYEVIFSRMQTPRYTADSTNLLTYDMDIKDVFNNLMLKDLVAEEDRKWVAVSNKAVGTLNAKAGTRYNSTGASGFVDAGPISRVSLNHLKKGLLSTTNALNPACVLINHITVIDIASLDRVEIGGDLAEDMFINGFEEREIGGTPYKITIKKDLVPNNIAYAYAGGSYLGDHYIMEDVTMETKTDGPMIEFYAHLMSGATIGNLAAVCKVDFANTLVVWE